MSQFSVSFLLHPSLCIQHFLIVTLFVSLTPVAVLSQIDDKSIDISFPSDRFTLRSGTTAPLLIHVTCLHTNTTDLHLRMVDESVARLVSNHTLTAPCSGVDTFNMTLNISVLVRGVFIGQTRLEVSTNTTPACAGPSANCSSVIGHEVAVLKADRLSTTVFVILVVVFISLLNVGFGCSVELSVLRAILRRPVGPLIGFLCQGVVLPLLGLAIAFALGMNGTALGFGLLVSSAAPGGGGSNVWTVIFNGELNLSLTMTFISKLLSLGLMPFWLFALGRFFISTDSYAIPYQNIATGLIALVVPLLIGVLLRRYKPTVSAHIVRAVKPLSFVFVVFVIVAGSVTNTFVYVMMGRFWFVIPSAMLLVYAGFTLGYLIARLTRLGHRNAVTVAIETGVQDTGIAIVLLQGAFREPEGDIASTIPVAIAIFTAVGLGVINCVRLLYLRLTGKSDKDGGDDVPADVTGDAMKVSCNVISVGGGDALAVNGVDTRESSRMNGVETAGAEPCVQSTVKRL